MKETGTEPFKFVFSKQPTTIAILLLFLLLYLPFINKTFHIDDPAFINLSKMGFYPDFADTSKRADTEPGGVS